MLVFLAACGGGDDDESGTASASKPSSVVTTVNASSGLVARRAIAPTTSYSGEATLSWRAPVTRVNGVVLGGDELASYEIRYGVTTDDLDRVAIFDRAAGLIDMSYTIENLAPGTWYFTIQARDSNGLLSSPSKVVSKNISG
jgi:hypothetical protein